MAKALTAHEEDLARSAAEKQIRGEEPLRDERRALTKWERLQAEEAAEKAYRAVPKKQYVKMSGTAYATLESHAEMYSLTALNGPEIDLYELLSQVHNLLKQNWRRFKDAEEQMLYERGSPAAERYRMAKAGMAEMDLERKKDELLPRGEMRQGLQHIANVIRQAGERLERRFGPDALDILTDALDDAETGIDRLFPPKEETN